MTLRSSRPDQKDEPAAGLISCIIRHPSVTLADAHPALAYYRDHRDEIEQVIAEENALVESFRRGHANPLREKLKRLFQDVVATDAALLAAGSCGTLSASESSLPGKRRQGGI